jgi:hypothetical protein
VVFLNEAPPSRTSASIFCAGRRKNSTNSTRRRVCFQGKNVPGVGLAPVLEDASVPQIADIEKLLRETATVPA